MSERSRVRSAHGSDTSPAYGAASGEMATALATAAALMVATVAAMVALADSPVADLLLVLYRTPILGVVVVGAGLTAGRYLGMRGLGTGSLALAAAGAVLSVATYGVLGGAVLTPYPRATYLPAIAAAGAITIAISLVAAAVVYATDRSFESWGRYSAYIFGGGLVAALAGTFVDAVLPLAFLLFLLGFLVDLVYEIWQTGSGDRSPLANGFGIYVAFAGVFVHVLQLALRMLARRG